MPKMKTHSGTKKRFSVTGSGKIVFQKSGRRHGLVHRTPKQLRNLRRKGVITPSFQEKMKELLPYA